MPLHRARAEEEIARGRVRLRGLLIGAVCIGVIKTPLQEARLLWA
jgi:hypothetical protein